MKNEYDYLNDVKMDFSLYNNEEITEREVKDMAKFVNEKNKKLKGKHTSKRVFIAVCAAVAAVTCTAFASEGYLDRIIKIIATGYNSYYQIDSSQPYELPDELKGKIFDKNGNALESLNEEDFGNIYDNEGNIIDNKKFKEMFEEVIDTVDDYDAETSEKNFESIEEAEKAAVFDIKFPHYIPKGYELERVYTYKDSDGGISGQYMTIEYKNSKGDLLHIFERILNEETAFISSTDGTVEETEINGRKAAIQNDNFIGWETEDNVSVEIATRGNISKEEMIKMAESVK